jgi:hypothetical protein
MSALLLDIPAIQKLPAGETLDALITRHVLGIVWPEDRCPICGWPLRQTVAAGCMPGNCSQRPRPERMASAPAAWSSDPVFAWRLVAHLVARRYRVRVLCSPEGTTAHVIPLDPAVPFVPPATADTPELAIARAALFVAAAGGVL